MIKLIISLIILIFCPNTYPQFDLSYSLDARSYPGPSGGFNVEMGHSFPLWGNPGKSNTMFGIIRPSLILDSSIVVSSYDANVTVYPISFIGLGIGKKEMKSEYDEFTYYDCDTIRCKGSLNKVYSMAKLAIAYQSFISSYTYRHFNNEYDDKKNLSLPVAEYEYAIQVNTSEETQVQKTFFLGYKLGENTLGLVSNNVEFLKSDTSYFLNIAIYQTQFSYFKTVLGAGTIGNSNLNPSGVIVLKLTHQLSPTLTLF